MKPSKNNHFARILGHLCLQESLGVRIGGEELSSFLAAVVPLTGRVWLDSSIFIPPHLKQALLQKKNKMLEEALQLALKAQEKVPQRRVFGGLGQGPRLKLPKWIMFNYSFHQPCRTYLRSNKLPE